MEAVEYFIVSYAGEDGKRRLVEFPISHQEYEQRDREFWEDERARSRPSAFYPRTFDEHRQ
jgi:hypothetical protein